VSRVLRAIDGTMDDRVDIEDLTVNGGAWLSYDRLVDTVPELAGQGIVDLQDLIELANAWLWQTQ